MATESEIEVYRALREGQDKYTYFLLAASGASIAFAITQTQGLKISMSQIPLAIAVIAWGLSFYCGCRKIAQVSSMTYANTELIRVSKGEHPDAGTHPQVIQAAREGILEAIEKGQKKVGRFSYWQFTFLVSGAVFYIAWHIFEMYLRGI